GGSGGGRRNGHAGIGSDEICAQIVRMTAMPGRDSPLFCKPLHERSQIRHKPILTNRETIELPARRRVLVFKNTDFAMLSRKHAITKLLVQLRQHIAATRKESADGSEPMPQFGRLRRLDR